MNVGGVEGESEPGSPDSWVKATNLCGGQGRHVPLQGESAITTWSGKRHVAKKMRRLKTEANPLGRYGS